MFFLHKPAKTVCSFSVFARVCNYKTLQGINLGMKHPQI